MVLEQYHHGAMNISSRRSLDQGSTFQERNPLYLPVISKFAELAAHPPGKDPSLKNFYTDSFRLGFVGLGKTGDRKFTDLLHDVFDQRANIDAKHFANLFFRAVQYVELFQSQGLNTNYLERDHTTMNWATEIKKILNDKEKKDILKELLLTRSTTTTIYQRYAGPAAAIAMLYADEQLNIADFGCGGNHGLPAFELQKSFGKINIQNSEDLTSDLFQQLPHIQSGLAIDWQNPYDENIRLWRLACSFYPQELNEFQKLIEFENDLVTAQKIGAIQSKFLQADLLNLPILEMDEVERDGKIQAHGFDIVIANTVLYQMSTEQRLQIIKNARRMLKRGGTLIISDFAEEDLSAHCGLNFDVDWHNGYSYATFIANEGTGWLPWEFLRWSDGRCKDVKSGKRFEQIKNISLPHAA